MTFHVHAFWHVALKEGCHLIEQTNRLAYNYKSVHRTEFSTKQLFQIRIPKVGPKKRNYVISMRPSIAMQNSKAYVIWTLNFRFGKRLKGTAKAIIMLFAAYLRRCQYFRIIIRVTKSSKIRWTRDVTHMDERRGEYRLWKRDHLEDHDVDGPIILEWIVQKSVGRRWAGLIWLSKRMTGFCEYGNEPSGSIKC